MSLTLGKIHFWLYSKIQWFEGIEEDILYWAKERGLPVEEWTKRIYAEYGPPTGKKPLEEMIDTANIHAWLQDRITGAELRQAALITAILDQEPGSRGELEKIFIKQGEKAASQYHGGAATPEEVYGALNDFLLEGMPCDRVNEVVRISDKEYVWETTMCLHKPHWESVKGDVGNFHYFREAWIKAFVGRLSPGTRYEKTPEGYHRIVRE